jgi:DNA-binding NtrC family response regulator
MGIEQRIAPQADVLSAGLRVLIVEDQRLIALAGGDIVEAMGGVVGGIAATVDEALALIAAEEIGLALLDFDLGGATSEPVAKALCIRGIPFVVTTGFRGELPDAYAGAPRLVKPYVPWQFRAALAAVLA